MKADVVRAFELGAVDYWTKPMQLDAFMASVAAQLGASGSAGTKLSGGLTPVSAVIYRKRDICCGS